MDQNGAGKPRQVAPGIRSTVSFIIFLEHVLGQGATSKVYLGRNKKTGKRVACKVPHGPGLLRLGIDLDRESQVLLRLRHPNIVCLEAIEKDQISRENILYMELCTGGSLYDRLEKPENSHGLEEKVFIDVMRDITCGMKYLRDNGLVHRDVKPGNIMCFVDDRGKTIYKLADFGAARELTDDENFTSLHGTEEYLHPKVYEKAVLRKPVMAAFDAKIDLWSIGATLYHIATGSLPFRPLGGRKNSSMMFHLTTKKESGVISGVQTGPSDAEIIWRKDLPETCQLSAGLQKLVTPLLAGLLEYNPSKVWSFSQFFQVSEEITSKTALDIFWVCESSNHKIYLNPSETFADFQRIVASQTRLPASQQSFLLNGESFAPSGTDRASVFPIVTQTNPIILFNSGKTPSQCQIYPPLVAIMPTLHPRFSTQNDFPIAKGATTVGHILQRRQSILHNMHLYFDDFVHSLRSILMKDLLELQARTNGFKTELSQIEKDLESGKKIIASRLQPQKEQEARRSGDDMAAYCLQLRETLDDVSQEFHQCEKEYNEVVLIHDKLSRKLSGKEAGSSVWQPSRGCNLNNNACKTELVYLTTQMEDILKRFSRDKKAGKLSYNDEQIHKMEKLNLGDLMKRTTKCIKKCEERWRDRHSELMVWFSESQGNRSVITRANSLLLELNENCAELKGKVADITSRCWKLINTPIHVSPEAVKAMAKIAILSASTQTSLPVEGAFYPSVTNGLGHVGNSIPMSSITTTTSSGQPVEMGGPIRMISGMGASHNVYANISNVYPNGGDDRAPRMVVPSAKRTPDSSHYASRMGQLPVMAPQGDNQLGGGSPGRMIKVSKQLKQDIEEYNKNKSSLPKLLKESSEVLGELEMAADLSLGDPETPPCLHDDSIFLQTLVPEGAEGGEEDLSLGKLVIKRPPTSYSAVPE